MNGHKARIWCRREEGGGQGCSEPGLPQSPDCLDIQGWTPILSRLRLARPGHTVTGDNSPAAILVVRARISGWAQPYGGVRGGGTVPAQPPRSQRSRRGWRSRRSWRRAAGERRWPLSPGSPEDNLTNWSPKAPKTEATGVKMQLSHGNDHPSSWYWGGGGGG